MEIISVIKKMAEKKHKPTETSFKYTASFSGTTESFQKSIKKFETGLAQKFFLVKPFSLMDQTDFYMVYAGAISTMRKHGHHEIEVYCEKYVPETVHIDVYDITSEEGHVKTAIEEIIRKTFEQQK